MMRKSPHLGLTYGGTTYDGGAELLTGRNLLAIKAEIERIAVAKSVQVDVGLDTGAFHSDAGLERTAANNLTKIRTALLALGAEDDPIGAIKLSALDGGSMVAMWQTLLRIDATLMALAEGSVPMVWKTPLPASKRFDAGARIEFSVEVSGGIQPYVYEWRNGSGTPYPSETNTLLVAASGNTGYNGVRVICKVTDQSGASIETAVNLTVVAPLLWTQQLSNVTVPEGNSHTFTVAASGGVTPYTYIWRDSSSQTSLGSAASLVRSAAQILEADGRTFTCHITDAEGSTLSTSAVLTVDRIPALAFTTQLPPTKSVNEAATIGLTVAATGGVMPYTYTWSDHSGQIGANSPTLSVAATEGQNGKTVRCIVRDSRGVEISSTCVLTVVLPDPITFPVALPSTYSAVAGTQFTFTVEVAGGITPYTYAWTVGGTAQAASGPTCAITPTEAMNGSVVKVKVTDSRSRTAESMSTLTVTAPAPDPEPEPGDDLAVGGDWTVGRGVAHGYMIDTQMLGPGVPYWMAYNGVYGRVENASQRDGAIVIALAASSSPQDKRVAVTFGEPGKTTPASMSGANVEFHYNGQLVAQGPVDSAGRWVRLIETFPEITELEPAKVVIHGPTDFTLGADHDPALGDWRTGAGRIENIVMRETVYDVETSRGFSQFGGHVFPRNGRIGEYCLQLITANTYSDQSVPDSMFLYFADAYGGPQAYKTDMAGRTVMVKRGGVVLWSGVLDENATAQWSNDVGQIAAGDVLTLEIAAP